MNTPPVEITPAKLLDSATPTGKASEEAAPALPAAEETADEIKRWLEGGIHDRDPDNTKF